MKRSVIFLVGLLCILSLAVSVFAEYPEKPITFIVMYSPGGSSDTFVRALQPGLEKALGQPIVVKNVTGGGGAVGFAEAVAARPDGYTVTLPNNAMFSLEGLGHVQFSYKDFDLVARVILEDYTVTVNADRPWNTFQEFVDDAQANPGKYKFGFSGVGSSTHIVSLALADQFNYEVDQVPYEGGAQAVAACMGGHIDALTNHPAEVISGVEAGELRTLVTFGEKRSTLLPDVPTLKEQGGDFIVAQWRGIGFPKGISDEVREAWENALKEAVKDPKFIETAEQKMGATISLAFGEELDQFVKAMADIFIPTAQALKVE